MLQLINKYLHSAIVFKWLSAMVVPPALSASRARGKSRREATLRQPGFTCKTLNEPGDGLQRKLYTGNFFAGPVAIIHPALLKPEAKSGAGQDASEVK